MSFGFAIGDFVTVGQLAWTLYCNCYKVARGAPQEFQLLMGEISTLSNSLAILQEEVRNPESTLVRAGEDRVAMVNEMVTSIGATLRSLEKVAKKYDILSSTSKRKQLWAKFKWSAEMSSIDGLRNKLIYHNTVMNLLLTSVGNSSLQRIESSTVALENDVQAIKQYIISSQVWEKTSQQDQNEKPPVPSLSAIDDDLFKTSLSAALMKNAEVSQPWSTIGVDQWIESGRWWLLRSQMELYTISSPKQDVPLAGYTNLIKASWILVDIIACHPQVPFIAAVTHAEVQKLSTELRNEFSRLSSLESLVPGLSDLEGQDLRIWEPQARGPLLRPQRDPRSFAEWIVEGGEQVLFQRFALCDLHALLDALPCVILFLVQEDARGARLIAQNQNGSVVMAIAFQKPVKLDSSGQCLIVNDEKITFTTTQDAQYLDCLIEAANFCLFNRKAEKSDLEDFKAYVLLMAVKNQCDDTVTRLTQGKFLKSLPKEGKPCEGVSALAYTYGCLRLKHELNEEVLEDSDLQRSMISLYSWAVRCGHHSLVKLLSEEQATADNDN